MRFTNTARNGVDSYTYNSNFSAASLIDEDRNNNKTEQIKLRRNLLNSTFKTQVENEQISTPKAISENSSIIEHTPEQPRIQLITYNEAYNYFQSLLYTNQYTEEKSGFCSCSSGKIKKKKNFIKNISRIKYDENNNIHFRILFTIYYFFTKRNCEKEGEHWQDIGFQSDTPGTDLITVGMFGPLQILYGIDYYPHFYTELFKYLLMRKCELFFASNLLSCSKFSLNILERGILDNIVNDNDNLLNVLNEIYVGMSYDYNNNIQMYGNSNILTIEFIVKIIQAISEKRTQTNYFLTNHRRN